MLAVRALFVCFAIFVAAPAPALGQAGERFVIPLAEDTLLFVENEGVTRILADLNGTVFKLASNPAEVARSRNAFLIPLQGKLTINIAAYMKPGEDANVITLLTQGPPGSEWRFVLAPTFADGETEVAYALASLEPLPETFGLRAWPNPTRGPLTAEFSIPDARITGVPVRLSVYDALGRRVAVLLDEPRFPGLFTVPWAGTAGLAAGVYLLHLDAGGVRETVRFVKAASDRP